MALVEPKMNTKDFDNVSLSGNESDASYDMAEDTLPTKFLGTESRTAKAVSEALKIDKKVKEKAAKGETSRQHVGPAEKAAWTKQAQMTSGDSDVESVTSVRSGLDGADIDRDNGVQAIGEEKEVEHFYDMLKDQKVTEYRSRFLMEVNAVLRVLDSNLGEQPVGLAGIPQHTRAIAAMFGDNVLQLRQIIQNLKISHDHVSSNLAQHQTAINSYKTECWNEVQSRRKLETLHLQVVHTAQVANARHEREKIELTRAISGIQEAKTRLEQTIEDYKGQLRTLQSKCREAEVEENAYKQEIITLQACKAGLKREAERYESQIAAYKVSLQAAEIEQRRERFSKEEFQRRLEKEESELTALEHDLKREAAVHEKAIRAEKREKKALAVEIAQLDNIRQSQAQELNRTNKSHLEALEAVKVEQQAKETAVADNDRLECQVVRLLHTVEEVKSEYSRMAEEERKARDVTRLENENLKKETTSLKKRLQDREVQNAVFEKRESDAKIAAQRENNKLHNELVRTRNGQETIRGELKEYQKALRDAMDERETEEEKHKKVVKDLEEKLAQFNVRIEGLHKFVKSMVITDGTRVETIEKLNTELTETNNSLEKLKVCLRSPNSYPQRQLIAALLDNKKESKAKIEALTSQLAQSEEECRKLQPIGEELLRTLKTCSTLVGEKHALATRIVFLEDEIASAETFRQNVCSTITSLLNEVDNNPESERLIEVMERAREMERRGEEVTNKEALTAVEDYIQALSQKLEDLDNQYRNSLSNLLEASMDKDESTPISISNQETRQERAATIAQQLLNHENTIQNLTTKLSTQSLTHKTTLYTLEKLQHTIKQLTASHAAALTELRERRDQVSEFETLQQEWELKAAKTTAQLNQFNTEVRCLQDLHESDRKEIEKAERQIRMFRRGSVQGLVEHVESVATGSDSVAAGAEDVEEAEDAGYAGGAEEDGEDA
ncbi:hypothetical protein DL98DRAFT_644066 [Cadophora sp. DSE1049]|nr:hypothetical protein DL98DRAFT_644066 [Cadophora sp. DSE1049]